MNNETYELSIHTLRKILNKESNKLLDQFIEYIETTCESYSLLDICRATDNYEESSWIELINSLAKDLKDYDVALDDEDDLTDCGFDLLIIYTQYEITENHRREYNLSVFGQESGVIVL